MTILICGLWDRSAIEGYRQSLRERTVAMVERGAYRGALLDASDYPIQPGTVAASHGEAMRIARTTFGVRAAVYMRGARPKLQMARLTEESGQRLFTCREDALDWLKG